MSFQTCPKQKQYFQRSMNIAYHTREHQYFNSVPGYTYFLFTILPLKATLTESVPPCGHIGESKRTEINVGQVVSYTRWLSIHQKGPVYRQHLAPAYYAARIKLFPWGSAIFCRILCYRMASFKKDKCTHS